MIAVEFETHVKNGKITIPEKYKEIVEGKLKIIILKNEAQPETSIHIPTRTSAMKQILKEIKEKNIFVGIDEPVQW